MSSFKKWITRRNKIGSSPSLPNVVGGPEGYRQITEEIGRAYHGPDGPEKLAANLVVAYEFKNSLPYKYDPLLDSVIADEIASEKVERWLGYPPTFITRKSDVFGS
jgi:hypothetical protein